MSEERSSSWVRTFSISFTLFVLLLLVAASLFLRGGRLPLLNQSAQSASDTVSNAWPTPPPTFTPLPQSTEAAVALPTALPTPSWSELGSLTSAKFSASTVVIEERAQLIGSDKIILMVVGDVFMGVDLKQLKPADVMVKGKNIQLTLPRAVIMSVELQLDQSKIYDSKRAWSSWIWPDDNQNLEKNALQKAQQQLREYAEDNPDMTEMAEKLARLQLTEFLEKAGFSKVEIKFKEK